MSSLQVFEEKLTADVVAAVNAIKPRIVELTDALRKEALTDAAKGTTKALFAVKAAVSSLDGVALLHSLKALRLSIVPLVKSARDANKYTADVHQCVVAVDATSKQFVDYVAAAAEQRRSQAIGAAVTVAAAAPVSAPYEPGGTIKRAQPASAANQRAALANKTSGEDGVESFLDSMERGAAGARAHDEDAANQRKRQLPPPRQQQFNDDDYNSLVAELELPAPKQAPAIRTYVPRAVVAPVSAPVVDAGAKADAHATAVALGVASNKQAVGGGKWDRSPAQAKAELEAAQAKAEAEARVLAQRQKDGLGAVLTMPQARPATAKPTAAIGKSVDVDLGDLLDEFTKESYRRSELVSQAKSSPVLARRDVAAAVPTKPTRQVGKSVDSEFDSLVADLSNSKSSSHTAGAGAAPISKAKQASLEGVLDSLLDSLDEPANVSVRSTNRAAANADSDALLNDLLSEIDAPKKTASAPAGYSTQAPPKQSQYGKTPLPPSLVAAGGGKSSPDLYQPLPGLGAKKPGAAPVAAAVSLDGYAPVPNIQKPAQPVVAQAYKAPAMRIPPAPNNQYGNLPPPPQARAPPQQEIIYDKAFGDFGAPSGGGDDGDDDEDPLALLDELHGKAEEDYVEHKKVPVLQEDPDEATALDDLLGALDIAAGSDAAPPPVTRKPTLATMDEDDEREMGIPNLTPQQARVELDQVNEFRALGLMSETEYAQKKAFLNSIIAGGGSGGQRIVSERTQAADVVDELLAELM
jgi:hypothetical protein